MPSTPIASTPFHNREMSTSSPMLSQYSIDFNALPGNHDGTEDSPLPGRQIKQIRSEDIEGPSDFTINMEKWMRGSLGHARTRSTGESQAQVTHSRLAHDRSGIANDRPSSAAPSSPSATPTPAKSHTAPDERTTTNASPSEKTGSMIDSTTIDQPQLNQLLRPTVEDFHSELTPHRPASSVAASESTVVAPATDDVEKSESGALFELRSQLADLRQRLHDSEQTVHGLRQRLDASEETIKTHKLDAQQHREALANAVSAREAAEADAARHKAELDEMCESEDAEMHALRCQLRDLKASQQTSPEDMESLRSELAKSRSEKAEAEQSFKSRIADVEAQLASASAPVQNTSEMETLRNELQTERTDRQRLEKELQAVTEEVDLLRDLSRFDDIPIVVHEPLAAKPSDTEIEFRSTLDKLRSELDTLKASNGSLADEKASLQSRLDAQASAVQGAASEHETLHAQLAVLARDLESTRSELQALRDTNTVFDARVSLAVRRREEHWAAQKQMWEAEKEKFAAERTFMARALMRQWGREECGVTEDWARGERQALVYRFGKVDV